MKEMIEEEKKIEISAIKDEGGGEDRKDEWRTEPVNVHFISSSAVYGKSRSYNYAVYPGNGPQLIKNALDARGNWLEVRTNNKASRLKPK